MHILRRPYCFLYRVLRARVRCNRLTNTLLHYISLQCKKHQRLPTPVVKDRDHRHLHDVHQPGNNDGGGWEGNTGGHVAVKRCLRFVSVGQEGNVAVVSEVFV